MAKVFLAILTLVIGGCAKPNDSFSDLKSIAREEVIRRESWTDFRVSDDIEHSDDGAVVVVERIPTGPGDFRYIRIVDGKVVEYGLGL
jgi:hypothetical protein